MTPRLIYSVDGCEVWHGDSLAEGTAETVLQGRRAELLHVDAPYSARTHEGHDAGAALSDRAGFSDQSSAVRRYAANPKNSRIVYSPWSGIQIARFALEWFAHVDGWLTTITDHVLAPEWERQFATSGRYVFPPLPWVEIGSRVRMTGDGPSSWACWTVVARPRGYSKWGTLPGAYVGPGENHQNRPERITGGKSLALTLQFLGDYSRRGDLVLDPCLGGGTTILAARMSGRRCIGIESDEGRAELCARLLGTKREQLGIFEGGGV